MKIYSSKSKKEKGWANTILKCCFLTMFIFLGTNNIFAQSKDAKITTKEEKTKARVIGLKNICVHVLQLEKTLKLYREILGFKMVDAEVFHGPGLEGMLAMKLKADDLTIGLSLTSPEFIDTIGPIGNTNHNHFMLKVNDIVPIGDMLKEEGYELENENYAKDKYTFFVGPNGEIIGLSAWD
ncbi:catechol 2,3-dioxygenase-like lactoylglutathione lyase family enzyme [Maribacter vaceletii]|uniref:Catechol 2,3-dioxygenase-like lactoylglutathione lyase family enzyme n=1 Tax=Maribacter vaceletii TaxID=1206816 RepID=A0A495ECF7_9FLAO|nr:VOC family protein [Maribacter vaceletii]RKR14568.1 catechol 2,3-dioxygenase-like lactoylglutathione lyase family enzyme [Maribacter vaceletii]